MIHWLQELYLNLWKLVWSPPRPVSTCPPLCATAEERKKFDETRLSVIVHPQLLFPVFVCEVYTGCNTKRTWNLEGKKEVAQRENQFNQNF